MDFGYNSSQYTTSRSANGGAGGGGFIAGGSQDNQGGKERSYADDTLRPVTIKQLNEAQQPDGKGNFKIDGAPIQRITFVGQVRNISTLTTNHTYCIDDGTGVMDVKDFIDPDVNMMFNDDDADSTNSDRDPRKPQLTENSYARVMGKLNQYNNKRHVVSHNVKEITDFNEVQYHLLEATLVHLQTTRGPLDTKNGAASSGINANGGEQQQQGSQGGNTQMLPAGLSQAAKRVYKCISISPQTNEGLHMHDIAMRENMDPGEVSRAGEELLGHGLIYSTIDEQTWAILDNF